MSKPAAIPQPSEPVERLSYRVAEVSRLTGLAKSTIHDLIRTRRLRAVHLGKIVLVPRSALEDLLNGDGA